MMTLRVWVEPAPMKHRRMGVARETRAKNPGIHRAQPINNLHQDDPTPKKSPSNHRGAFCQALKNYFFLPSSFNWGSDVPLESSRPVFT
ncbi:MAG: hypothetical protein ACREX5_04480, partial [Achromobacter pestifer]